MRVRVTVALAAVLALAGCGAEPVSRGPVPVTGAPTTPAAPGATPARSAIPTSPTAPPSPATVSVTAGLRETTARLRVGQALVVRPTPGRPGRAHAVITEPGSTVLRGDGGNHITGWRFLALGRGTAHVGIVYEPQCVHGELCPMFRGLLGRVTVTVL